MDQLAFSFADMPPQVDPRAVDRVALRTDVRSANGPAAAKAAIGLVSSAAVSAMAGGVVGGSDATAGHRREDGVLGPRQVAAARLHPRRKRWTFGRYARRRRALALPKPFSGFGAYRLVMTGALAHVVGLKGVPCGELTAWARDLLAPEETETLGAGARPRAPSHDNLSEVRRIAAALDAIRQLLDAINWVQPTYPEVLRELLDPNPSKARAIVLHWLRLRGCDLQQGRGANGGRIVHPRTSDEQWTIGVTITRFRQLFEFWDEAGIRKGHNPMQMDKERSRMRAGEKRRLKHAPRRWWLDVDGLFRTRHVERQAPRPGDPRVALRILERGREMGWPLEVYLKFQGMYLTGARMGQMDAATAYGLLVAAKDDRHIALIQKGSKGELSWQAATPKAWREAVLAMLAGRVPGGMKTLLRWARSDSEIDKARLRKLYIFSPDGRSPTPQWKSAHLLRVVVEDLDISFDLRRDDGSKVRRWFTSHWFRHVFVNRMLDRIAASSADESTRAGARRRFASYMGWKQAETMLAYYGRYHDEQEADLLVMRHQDDLNDEVLDGFRGEDWWIPSNDNAVLGTDRVCGDLLA